MRRRDLPPEVDAAIRKYEQFHRLPPKQVGAFPASFQVPETLYRAGRAVHVLYRSSKVDPETLRKPKRPVDYIHEHDRPLFGQGVTCYLPEPDAGPLVRVPDRFRDVPALVRLGFCLGLCFEDGDGECELKGARPLPDLYATPDGKCLLVIQSRRDVLAMVWGGNLGVYARGIDG